MCIRDSPELRQGVGWPSWKLQGDGSYRTSDRNASSGQWSELGGGYLLVGDLGEPIYAGLYGDVQNINWDSDAIDPYTQIETRRRNEYRLAVVETGQQTWRAVIWQQSAEYATDTSLLIDPTQPVRLGSGQSVYEIEILAPTSEFMPFTSAELSVPGRLTTSTPTMSRSLIIASKAIDRVLTSFDSMLMVRRLRS